LVNFQNPVLSDDSLRAVLDTVLSAPAYQWTETEPRLSWLARWWRTLVDWLGRFRESNPTAADILFWSLAAVLVIIFVHGGWIMYRTIRGATEAEGRGVSAGALAIRDERWFQRLADQLAGEGRFAEAMQAAFTALALRLEARGVLRFHPSKTPREYAREARLADSAKTTLQASVSELYAHAYAGRPCSRDQYRAWLMGLDQEWHAASN
jgi:hypothetical protein